MAVSKKIRDARIAEGVCADCGKEPLISKRLGAHCLEIARKSRKTRKKSDAKKKQNVVVKRIENFLQLIISIVMEISIRKL